MVFSEKQPPAFFLLPLEIYRPEKASLANIKHKPTVGLQNWHYINCQR